jgi:transcriptional regulator with PAS, ATPase and Fis domain
LKPSSQRKSDEIIQEQSHAEPISDSTPSDKELTLALARVGKFSREDELNCGACGYSTCREFAKALIEHKAEEAMCHTYLRKNFERTSNALIRFIPAAVVMVDENLNICECNRNFALITEMTDVYDTLGNLNSLSINNAIPGFGDLFESVIENGGEIEKFNQKFNDKIINISVFTVARGKFAGAVIQDMTKNELQREQIAEKAREVIRKNVLTVQQVARLFGEHVADTEIILNEIAGSYEGGHGAEK